mmetsp:Transcript_5348/g.7848  ORF Transcript_5348/g.7848 Transcript_5348/m.7848 type:complete len:135 (-) Transcript_5348:25-429(-)
MGAANPKSAACLCSRMENTAMPVELLDELQFTTPRHERCCITDHQDNHSVEFMNPELVEATSPSKSVLQKKVSLEPNAEEDENVAELWEGIQRDLDRQLRQHAEIERKLDELERKTAPNPQSAAARRKPNAENS